MHFLGGLFFGKLFHDIAFAGGVETTEATKLPLPRGVNRQRQGLISGGRRSADQGNPLSLFEVQELVGPLQGRWVIGGLKGTGGAKEYSKGRLGYICRERGIWYASVQGKIGLDSWILSKTESLTSNMSCFYNMHSILHGEEHLFPHISHTENNGWITTQFFLPFDEIQNI